MGNRFISYQLKFIVSLMMMLNFDMGDVRATRWLETSAGFESFLNNPIEPSEPSVEKHQERSEIKPNTRAKAGSQGEIGSSEKNVKRVEKSESATSAPSSPKATSKSSDKGSAGSSHAGHDAIERMHNRSSSADSDSYQSPSQYQMPSSAGDFQAPRASSHSGSSSSAPSSPSSSRMSGNNSSFNLQQTMDHMRKSFGQKSSGSGPASSGSSSTSPSRSSTPQPTINSNQPASNPAVPANAGNGSNSATPNPNVGTNLNNNPNPPVQPAPVVPPRPLPPVPPQRPAAPQPLTWTQTIWNGIRTFVNTLVGPGAIFYLAQQRPAIAAGAAARVLPTAGAAATALTVGAPAVLALNAGNNALPASASAGSAAGIVNGVTSAVNTASSTSAAPVVTPQYPINTRSKMGMNNGGNNNGSSGSAAPAALGSASSSNVNTNTNNAAVPDAAGALVNGNNNNNVINPINNAGPVNPNPQPQPSTGNGVVNIPTPATSSSSAANSVTAAEVKQVNNFIEKIKNAPAPAPTKINTVTPVPTASASSSSSVAPAVTANAVDTQPTLADVNPANINNNVLPDAAAPIVPVHHNAQPQTGNGVVNVPTQSISSASTANPVTRTEITPAKVNSFIENITNAPAPVAQKINTVTPAPASSSSSVASTVMAKDVNQVNRFIENIKNAPAPVATTSHRMPNVTSVPVAAASSSSVAAPAVVPADVSRVNSIINKINNGSLPQSVTSPQASPPVVPAVPVDNSAFAPAVAPQYDGSMDLVPRPGSNPTANGIMQFAPQGNSAQTFAPLFRATREQMMQVHNVIQTIRGGLPVNVFLFTHDFEGLLPQVTPGTSSVFVNISPAQMRMLTRMMENTYGSGSALPALGSSALDATSLVAAPSMVSIEITPDQANTMQDMLERMFGRSAALGASSANALAVTGNTLTDIMPSDTMLALPLSSQTLALPAPESALTHVAPQVNASMLASVMKHNSHSILPAIRNIGRISVPVRSMPRANLLALPAPEVAAPGALVPALMDIAQVTDIPVGVINNNNAYRMLPSLENIGRVLSVPASPSALALPVPPQPLALPAPALQVPALPAPVSAQQLAAPVSTNVADVSVNDKFALFERILPIKLAPSNPTLPMPKNNPALPAPVEPLALSAPVNPPQLPAPAVVKTIAAPAEIPAITGSPVISEIGASSTVQQIAAPSQLSVLPAPSKVPASLPAPVNTQAITAAPPVQQIEASVNAPAITAPARMQEIAAPSAQPVSGALVPYSGNNLASSGAMEIAARSLPQIGEIQMANVQNMLRSIQPGTPLDLVLSIPGCNNALPSISDVRSLLAGQSTQNALVPAISGAANRSASAILSVRISVAPGQVGMLQRIMIEKMMYSPTNAVTSVAQSIVSQRAPSSLAIITEPISKAISSTATKAAEEVTEKVAEKVIEEVGSKVAETATANTAASVTDSVWKYLVPLNQMPTIPVPASMPTSIAAAASTDATASAANTVNSIIDKMQKVSAADLAKMTGSSLPVAQASLVPAVIPKSAVAIPASTTLMAKAAQLARPAAGVLGVAAIGYGIWNYVAPAISDWYQGNNAAANPAVIHPVENLTALQQELNELMKEEVEAELLKGDSTMKMPDQVLNIDVTRFANDKEAVSLFKNCITQLKREYLANRCNILGNGLAPDEAIKRFNKDLNYYNAPIEAAISKRLAQASHNNN